MKRAIPLLLLLSTAACGGGGGGGGDDSPYYAGVWRGSLLLVENTCPGADLDPTVSFQHTVNQDGRRVVVENDFNGTTFAGEVESDGSFLATGSVIRSSACSGLPGVGYSGLEGDSATVVFAAVLRCADGGGGELECRFAYAGTGRRG